MPQQGYALVGNPGAGKSTILNGIADKPAFCSGISLCSGLTDVLQKYELPPDEDGDSIVLYDTPGLADIEKRKKAGKELDKMLQDHVPIKLIFVVTLERGRVKPDDAATIKLILETIHDVDLNDKFGVVLNQVSPGVKQKLENEKEKRAELQEKLTGVWKTSHWVIVLADPALEEKDNGKLMTEDLFRFLAALPNTKGIHDRVSEVDTTVMDDVVEEYKARFLQLETQSKAERAEMMRQYKELEEKAAERDEYFEVKMGEMRKTLKNYQRTSTVAGGVFVGAAGAGAGAFLGIPALMVAGPAIALGAIGKAMHK